MSGTRPITAILVANRGEIARRVFRTANSMGLSTVAIYSEPDAATAHVVEADIAVALGGITSAETYLDGDKVLAAAKLSGADAIHPGYGFLSENASFAQAVIDAGLTWIGPSPDAIRAMGDKISALTLMEAAGVPTLPRTRDLADAATVGFPLLVKASAGGGGKGMRIVTDPDSLTEAVEGARREALRAFSNDDVYLEKYISRARHIEIQVVADKFGSVRHLFERECSIQRRHQKVIEEAPSPFVGAELREAMGSAAVAAARSVNYEGVGTVEFIVDDTGGFYFLEMNTRLQVEHPVTEMITGVDLVREQIRVARGEPLSDAEVAIIGASVEARLYAEDPGADYLPSSGHIAAWKAPDLVRIDAGVAEGESVSVHYDPMMAKVISHGATRAEAIDRLCRALGELRVHGTKTNRAYLRNILRTAAFAAGDTHTSFLDEHREILVVPPSASAIQRAAAAAAVAGRLNRIRSRPPVPSVPPGWRNNRGTGEQVSFLVDGVAHDVEFWAPELLGTYNCFVDGEHLSFDVLEWDGTWLDVVFGGCRQRISVIGHEARWWVQDQQNEIELVEQPRFPTSTQDEVVGALTAPMNGTVIGVSVQVGDVVSAGTLIMVLEAMKMEHRIVAPAAGVVAELLTTVGSAVSADDVLVIVSDQDEE